MKMKNSPQIQTRRLRRYTLAIILGLFFFVTPTFAEDEVATTTPSTTPSITVNLHVRYLDEMIFEGMVELAENENIIVTDNTGADHTVTTTSALSALKAADMASASLEITSVGFYQGIGLYIKCLNLPTIPSNACDYWLYTVNDVSPWLSIDNYLLQNGDDVYLYFGQPYRVSVSTSTVQINQSFTALAEQYRYRTNEWQPRPGVTVGATQPDPGNPWSPLVIATSTTDGLGIGAFNLSATGTYDIGVAEDFYYPTAPITITSIPEVTSDVPIPAPTNPGIGSPVIHQTLNTEKAIQFLTSPGVQQADGSILNSAYISDWTAMAFAAYSENNPGKELLKNYLLTDPNTITGMNETADYARRAMSLLSLGINPYTGTNTNYIQKLTGRFTGDSFGGDELYNDDIFALFPLLHSGYTVSDPIIVSTTVFILTKQESNGSWFGTDITAAAVQALAQVNSLPGVSSALDRAKTYLHTQQRDNGSFNDNVDSTSWALQAITAFGETEIDWIKNNNTPGDYLAHQQIFEDGGVGVQSNPVMTRAWSTAYAIPAALGKNWNSILTTVQKPIETVQTPPPASTPPTVAPFITPTTTEPIVTSTLPLVEITTTTEPIVVVPASPQGGPTLLTAPTPAPAFPESAPRRQVAGVRIESEDEAVVTTTAETVAENVAVTTPVAEKAKVEQPEEPKSSIPVVPLAAAGTVGIAMYLGWKFFGRVV